MILPFELDPQIIHHIIYSQAGSIGKAVIELLMNSDDAKATMVRLAITKEGFECVDDGNGFASREDVVRYFGRFGTPHEEGDATYGRFRLGRGQIMAHASTVWSSLHWKMTVDTQRLGYNYDLEDLEAPLQGCTISGRWYEPLTDEEMMSAIQEVRDLVRYTPIRVDLNERTITRDPTTEKWDCEDEFAYYRVKAEGAVSIYNQGVLVRHDSSHLWGAGGLIVSKRAIGVNVSRTEILRKTCPVWKAIAKQFGKMAEQMSAQLGDNRKTEARREKSARALLSADANLLQIFEKEEVITVLPGKRHITLCAFLDKAHREGQNRFAVTVVENGFDIPKGEAIAREGIAQVVHPLTLERFGCFTPEDFRETMERVIEHVAKAVNKNSWWERCLHAPALADFNTLKKAFIERTRIVTEKDSLDKETRRAWVALRWCIQQYAGICLGGQRYTNGALVWDDPRRLNILIGESNKAEAWTDCKSYLAINIDVVKRLKSEPLKTVGYIFGLVEHEIAHEGDSIDCGHDEAFYQRYHDISVRMGGERQRYVHLWLQKYTYSLENEGKKQTGQAWHERVLADRAGKGRQKRGLPRVIEGVEDDPAVRAFVPDENVELIDRINTRLTLAGLCPPPPDWDEVAARARHKAEEAWQEVVESKAAAARADALRNEEFDQQCRAIAAVLGVELADISEEAMNHLWCFGETDEDLRRIWANKEWDRSGELYDPDGEVDPGDDYEDYMKAVAEGDAQLQARQEARQRTPHSHLDENLWPLIREGETWWMLERNAAAAGFYRVSEYLEWRGDFS